MRQRVSLIVSSAAASGATILAAVTSRKIRVISIALTTPDAAATVTFKSNTTALTGAFALAQTVTLVANAPAPRWPADPTCLFETASGEALKADVVTGGVAGLLIYELVE